MNPPTEHRRPLSQRSRQTLPRGRRRPARQGEARSRRPVRHEISAGGVAARKEGNDWLVALLKTEHKRGEVWVLPKGHVELAEQETVADAARREVEEEAGLSDLSVKDQLGVTRFTFQAEEALVRKTVHYFLMETQQKKLTPQVEEGLIDAAWEPFDKAIALLTYDTDKDIVARAREKLTGIKAPRARRRQPARGRNSMNGASPAGGGSSRRHPSARIHT
jgi:ADP-ribose pyrophosphatase YjhB (NUDIX family)